MFVRFAKLRAVLLVVLVAAAFLPVLAFAQGDAAGAIASAKQQLVACYDSARQAESAGANISSLTSVLNEAGDLLSRSELAYSQSDLGGAQSLAVECSQKLSDVVSEADSLRVGAVEDANLLFVWAVASVVAAVVVVVCGFLVWRYVSKKFLPVGVEAEVESDESS